jgi:hypothetical protein
MNKLDLQAELDVRDNRMRMAESQADAMAAALSMLWHTTPSKTHPVIAKGFATGRKWEAARKKQIRPKNNQISYGRGKRSKVDA